MPACRVIVGLMFSVAALLPAADLSPLDRRLNVAVLGFSFDQATAEAALRDGASINQRNDANGGETLLIGAVKGMKEPAVIRFLLEQGIDRNAKDASGRTALDYAQQYKIGNTPEGQAVMALLASGAQRPPDSTHAATRAPSLQAPAPASAATPAPAQHTGSTAAFRSVAPGVYECMNQMGMITPMAFGILDNSTYMNANAKRGSYTFDAASSTLTLDPGSSPARYRLINATTFRPIRENGQLGGFTCPLNRAKNPQRPPW